MKLYYTSHCEVELLLSFNTIHTLKSLLNVDLNQLKGSILIWEVVICTYSNLNVSCCCCTQLLTKPWRTPETTASTSITTALTIPQRVTRIEHFRTWVTRQGAGTTFTEVACPYPARDGDVERRGCCVGTTTDPCRDRDQCNAHCKHLKKTTHVL